MVELSLEHPELTPRELSVLLLEESQIFVYESSFYRILHERGLLERMEHDFIFAADEFHHKTKFVNEMWQTDFTYFKVKSISRRKLMTTAGILSTGSYARV